MKMEDSKLSISCDREDAPEGLFTSIQTVFSKYTLKNHPAHEPIYLTAEHGELGTFCFKIQILDN